MGYKCCVQNCRSGYDSKLSDKGLNILNEKVRFFGFPKDETIRQSWRQFINRENYIITKHSKVCSLHFKDTDIVSSSTDKNTARTKTNTELKIRRLQSSAIPTIRPEECLTPDQILNGLNAKCAVDATSIKLEPIDSPSDEEIGNVWLDCEAASELLPVQVTTFDCVYCGEVLSSQLDHDVHLFHKHQRKVQETQTDDLSLHTSQEENPKSIDQEKDVFAQNIEKPQVLDQLNSKFSNILFEEKENIKTLKVALDDMKARLDDFTNSVNFSIYMVKKEYEKQHMIAVVEYLKSSLESTIISFLMRAKSEENVNMINKAVTEIESCDKHGMDDVDNEDVDFEEDGLPQDNGEAKEQISSEDISLISTPTVCEKRKQTSCWFCNIDFTSKDMKKQHFQEHHIDGYPCNVCSKNIKDKAGYKSHIKTCNGYTTLICDKCGRNFATFGALMCHLKSHDYAGKPKKYECRLCKKKSSTHRELIEHFLSEHKQEKPFACRFCSMTTISKALCKRHEETHTERRMFTCSICNSMFTRNEGLKLHLSRKHDTREASVVSSHTKIIITRKPERKLKTKKLYCSICNKGFFQHSTLFNHVKNTHEDSIEHLVFKCTLCDMSFPYKHQLTTHRNRHHVMSEKYECPKCPQTFVFKMGPNGLFKHLQTHPDRQVFNCDLCQRRFTSKRVVNIHKSSVHYKKRPYCCTVCNKSFSLYSSLAKHNNIHTKEKVYPCRACDKNYYNYSSLLFHIRSHTGQKPYSCQLCSKSYTEKKGLLLHRKTHL